MSTPDSIQAENQSAQVPDDFKMIMGMGGGVGGRVRGYSVDVEGVVQKWEGKYPEENIQSTGVLSSDEVQSLWVHVEEAGYFTLNQQDMSGTGQFIIITANGNSHRVSWKNPLGQKPDSTQWQQLYDACVDMAKASLTAD